MQMGENSFCKHSDYVVSLLVAAKKYFMKHGMKAKSFKPIMNGIVLEEWENPTVLPQEHQQLLDDLHRQGKFIICFFGSVNVSYAVDYLIKAQQKLNDDRVAIVIVGEGNQKEELKKKVGDGVYFLPRIPKTAIPTLMDNIDCCYVGALHNDMFRFGICMNKLFDSMMSGKPVLYAVEAPNNFITDYNCGVSVKAEDVDQLVAGIKSLLEMRPEEREQLGKNGRNAVLEHFSYKQLAAQFAELFE
jgi:glycosyltransferase involved in cell wall biosynthesis